MKETEVVLRVTGLRKYFGHGRTLVRAVDGVDLEAATGEIVLIMGPSGSGKTTLLTLIGVLLTPDQGRIVVDGVDMSSLTRSQLTAFRREHIGFIFQSFNLLDALKACENVELPMNTAGVTGRRAHERAAALLEERGLGDRMDFKPKQLSGGERQRVSIARALANQPRLILADEPTANLDSKHGHDTLMSLQAIAKDGGRTVVIVSHDQRVREVADRVLWLEDGRFKDMSRLARDPVCGMQVEVEAAAATLQHGGRTFYFCSRGCSWEFQEDPARFAAI